VSQSERATLADLLEELGPDAPTCCAGWTTRDLAAHLVVRDRRPDAAPGLVLGGRLGAWTQRVRQRSVQRPYPELVAEVRSGPPRWVPTAWPVLDRVLNTVEMVIHHEDVRRAQPSWFPRQLARGVQDQLWSMLPFLARGRTAPRTPGGLVVVRTDVPAGPDSERRLRTGEPTTTVSGLPLEVLLWLSGRTGVSHVDVVG
jgi:uncharacterized protein (TIGR03085 family)